MTLTEALQQKGALYKNLPDGAQSKLNNLHKVSKGVSEALGEKITTGRITSLFDQNKGLVSKLMDTGVRTMAAAKAGPLGATAVNEFLAGSTDVAKNADTVLSSPAFQNIVKQAVKDGVTEGAQASDKLRKMEGNFAKTKAYKEWEKTLSEATKTQLATGGFVAYLLGGEE